MPTAISDLFFNLDHQESELNDINGDFVGYSEISILHQSTWFLDTLSDLVAVKVSPEQLREDFFKRL